MDVLSEVLKVVKLQGALFYNGEFSAPWCVNASSARALAVRRNRGEAGTEELRQAVVNYRALFDDLLKTDEGAFRRAS